MPLNRPNSHSLRSTNACGNKPKKQFSSIPLIFSFSCIFQKCFLCLLPLDSCYRFVVRMCGIRRLRSSLIEATYPTHTPVRFRAPTIQRCFLCFLQFIVIIIDFRKRVQNYILKTQKARKSRASWDLLPILVRFTHLGHQNGTKKKERACLFILFPISYYFFLITLVC